MTTPPDGTPRHLPWSRRRRRTLQALGAAAVLLGAGAFVLPGAVGVTSGLLAGLCVLLLVAATAVFLAVPGPGTAGVLLRSPSLGGAVAVVSVLLVLSTQGTPLARWWDAVAVAAALWTAVALWRTRRPGRGDATRD